jgi:hypothetical protein
MKNRFPVTPYPSVGEIVYACSVGSGLVRSNEKNGHLYDSLKGFKDDRKRPGLRPIEFPKYVLVDLQDRLETFIGDGMHAHLFFGMFRCWLDWYASIISRHDATLLEREDMVEKILWPSIFSAGASSVLLSLERIFPTACPSRMLADKAPFGRHLRLLCVRGDVDFKMICEHRAQKHDIDFVNCRDTLDEWLSGKAVPNLDSCLDILHALGLASDTASLTWILIARLLADTSAKYRAHILTRMTTGNNLPSPEEHLHQLQRQLAWDIGEKLNIGPDRPYAKLRDALYDPTVPRDAAAVTDMLVRLERTWQPIRGQTQHTIEWLRGRFLVLSGKLDEGYQHYLAAYRLGAGRDPDVYREMLDEVLALAGKLGKKRAVERFEGLLGLYWTTEWNGEQETLPEHFQKKFPENLYFR